MVRRSIPNLPPGTDPAEPAPAWASAFPHVAELAAAARHDGVLGGCDDDAEFAFGLDLILDGLERRRVAETSLRPDEFWGPAGSDL